MPATLSYPGVYVEEIPSGVHPITGVATSIAAFVGYTRKGVPDKPVAITSFADFERRYGGLDRVSPLSYAVRQFFLNGGTQALIVRVATGYASAAWTLQDGAGTDVLDINAASPGAWGNDLRLSIQTDANDVRNPDSDFSLVISQLQADGKTVATLETYRNLSMDSRSPQYVVSVVNNASTVISATRPDGLAFNRNGFAVSKAITFPLSPGDSAIRGTIDGTTPFSLTLISPSWKNGIDPFVDAVSAAITTAGYGAQLEAAKANADGGDTGTKDCLRLKSKTTTEISSVVIAGGAFGGLTQTIGLGLANGGREFAGAVEHRPAAVPDDENGFAVSKAITFPLAPSDTTIRVTVDGTTQFQLHVALPPPPADPSWANMTKFVTAVNAVITTAGAQLVAAASNADGGDTGTKDCLRLKSKTKGGSSSVVIAAGGLAQAIGLGLANGGSEFPTFLVPSTAGNDGGKGSATDLVGDQSGKSGIYALLDVDLFNLLCIPETYGLTETDAAGVVPPAVALCEQRRAFYIVDAPSSEKLADVATWANGASQSRNAATYFPAVRISDPLDGLRPKAMAPSGTLAGVYARTDAARGVWKAPAGTDATLNGVLDLAAPMNDIENGSINIKGVNALRNFPAYGRVVWGARTMKGADAQADEYKYVPVRRLALFLEESLYRGTQWVVFEPNDEPLWSQIRLNIGSFMQTLFRQGAFQGATPKGAYFVKCDKETTTQDDINLGIVNILVGFAPLKPAEFVVLQIQQMAGQTTA